MIKHFYPRPFQVIFRVSFLALIAGSAVYAFFYAYNKDFSFIVYGVGFSIFGLISIFPFIRLIAYRIDLNESSISTRGELFRYRRVQYKMLVEYGDIADMNIVYNSIDSKGKYLRWGRRVSKFNFIEFTLKTNGKRAKKARILISYLSPNKKEELIELLEKHTGIECKRKDLINNRELLT